MIQKFHYFFPIIGAHLANLDKLLSSQTFLGHSKQINFQAFYIGISLGIAKHSNKYNLHITYFIPHIPIVVLLHPLHYLSKWIWAIFTTEIMEHPIFVLTPYVDRNDEGGPFVLDFLQFEKQVIAWLPWKTSLM